MDHLEHLNHINPKSFMPLRKHTQPFNLFLYDKFLKPGIILVALFWNPSSISAYFTFIGVQHCKQYSRCSLTYDIYSFEINSENLYNSPILYPTLTSFLYPLPYNTF